MMKKILFLTLLAGLTLASCSKDENNLVGRWRLDHVNILFKLNGVDKNLQNEAKTNPGAAALLSMVQSETGGLVIEFTENKMTIVDPPMVDYVAENGIIYAIIDGTRQPLFKYHFEGEFLVIFPINLSSFLSDEEYQEMVYGLEAIFGSGVSDVNLHIYLKKI